MYENLQFEIIKQKLTIRKISEDLQWNYDTLRNKLNGDSDWWRNEMFSLQEKYFKNCTLEYLFKFQKKDN